MENEIFNKLARNYFLDLQKNQTIDKFERAKIIKNYLDNNKFSIREMSRVDKIPKSTIEDWSLWNRIDINEFKLRINQGETETSIYRLLRDNKKIEITEFSEIDVVIDNTINCLNRYKNYSKFTFSKLDLLQKAINTFKFRNKL